MRIAIDGRYIQDHFPGIARYTYNLLANLADLVDEEITLYYNPRLANTRYRIADLERPGKVRLQAVDIATFSPAEQVRLPLRLLNDKVDIFHSPYYLKPYVSAGKSLDTIHDIISAVYPQYMPSWRARVMFQIATRMAIASARTVFTLSEHSKKDIVSHYGVNPDKIVVTYLAADARFQPRERGSLEHIRGRYGLPRHFILYVGINKPHKNLTTLVKAFDCMRDGLDAALVIAGSEDRRYAETRAAAQRAARGGLIRFLGNVADDDLPYLYNLADLFVFPSLYEGFGLPPLEAMASGTPVICSNSSSLPEVVGEAGLLFEPHDSQALAEAMARVLEDERLRERLRARGLEQAARFSWRETAAKTLQRYKREWEIEGPPHL